MLPEQKSGDIDTLREGSTKKRRTGVIISLSPQTQEWSRHLDCGDGYSSMSVILCLNWYGKNAIASKITLQRADAVGRMS